MKNIFISLLSGFMSLASAAQTITVTFNGANKNRNYQVVLDGTSYYSNSSIDPNNPNANTRKEVILTNQQLGSHSISIYRMRNNNGSYTNATNTNPSGSAVYTNTFQLRQGYDMNIAVNGNGQITFTERRIRNRGNRGYNQQTVTPMTDATYNQILQSVRNKWTQSSKVTAERDAFSNTANYFTTTQVRELLLLISTENNRLALAKLAYQRVVDPANFNQVYDIFNSTSSRNELDIFIRNNPNNNNYNNNSNWSNNNNNQYRTAMADYQFNQLLQNINNQWNQSAKVTSIRDAFYNSANYFSTNQIRQLLSLINTELDRLTLAKLSYAKVSDPSNFSSLYDLLYSQASRNELNNYVIQNGGTGTNVSYNVRTAMADETFSQVLQKASNHFLPWDKLRDVRDDFNNTAYNFSTSQIRQLLTIISSEADRLSLAKLAWSRVTDASSFTQLFDLFATQSSRDDLNNYISTHPQ